MNCELLPIRWTGLTVIQATVASADRLGELLFQLRLVGGLVEAECLLHLGQQVFVKELRHLGALGVYDAV